MAMERLRIAAKESKVMKFVLGGFIALAVGGLVFTDVSGVFTGVVQPSTTVATVDDVDIDFYEIDQPVQQFVSQYGLPASVAYQTGMVQRVIDDRIDRVLKAQQANELDLRIDSNLIAKGIHNSFAPQLSEGENMKDFVTKWLITNQMTQAQLEDLVALNMRNQVVSNTDKMIHTYLPGYLQRAQTRISLEKRSGVLITFDTKKLVKTINVSDDELKAYFESNKADYTIPEKRRFSVAVMTADMLKDSVEKPQEETLREEYDTRLGDFTIPEKRTISQVTINDEDQVAKIKEWLANNESNDLKAALKAVTESEDGFLDKAEFAKADLPEAVSHQVFDQSAKVDDVVGPVKTALGWTLAKLEDVIPAKTRPFDDVKKEIEDELFQNALYDSLFETIMQAEDAYNTGTTFDEQVKALRLKVEDTDLVSQDGDVSVLPDNLQMAIQNNSALMKEMFSAAMGQSTFPIELDDETVMIIGVKEIENERPQDFADVKDDIDARIKDEKKEESRSQVLEEMIASLNSGDKSLNDIIKQYKGKKKTVRNREVADESEHTKFFFGLPVQTYNHTVDGDKTILGYVRSANFSDDLKDDGKLAADPYDKAKEQYGRVLDSLERQYLRENADIDIHEEILEQAYGEEAGATS